MNNQQIENLFSSLNSEYFNDHVPEIPVAWNKRLRTTAGRCAYKGTNKSISPTKIELSYKLFQSLNWNSESIKNTLLHEMTHAYLIEKYNDVSHGDRFQSVMTKITGKNINHTYHSYDISSLQNRKNVEVFCPLCNSILFYRSRMPSKGKNFTHDKCGSRVEFRKKSNNNLISITKD